ncbi:12227_t:CDS:10 [Cetraspora pellucida]|uniref:12227_t:CDS:1 n=1 Tax=Cetraspora pellucida TaxID=1433469 RepID=A0A9N9D2Z6_9GLOM|nr:12227_t:CDS:10 [Cetraspora pellucida]
MTISLRIFHRGFVVDLSHRLTKNGKFVFAERENIITLAQKCRAQVPINEETLEGYQLYIVEQWACDRRPYNTVTVFTGEPTHKIKVCVVFIEEKLQPYPEKLESLFSNLEEDKTRLKDTHLGKIFVTNLSSFPSSLSTILVTDGDYNASYPQFRLNLNLRRISCSSKNALSLKPPTEVQKQKFFQLYSVPDKIQLSVSEKTPFDSVVIQLVKHVQMALHLIFGFPLNLVDGLLCNTTESFLKEFKNEHAPNFETLDNIFDPNLISIIFKMVLSIRNKLNYLNYQVGKDPFVDTETFLNGVASFQKSARRDTISHKLDSEIVNKINEAYNRSRYPDGVKFRKVINQFEKNLPGISSISSHLNTSNDIETYNLEEFWKNFQFEGSRCLWKGKDESSESDLFHGSKELGKSFLRGVSGRTAKTGEVIREGVRGLKEGVSESLSHLVDRGGISREKDKLMVSSGKSLTSPLNSSMYLGPPIQNDPEIYDKSRMTANMTYLNNSAQNSSEYVTSTTDQQVIDSSSSDDGSSYGSDTENSCYQRRRYSFNIYDDIKKSRELPIYHHKRSKSFTTAELARKQGARSLHRRTFEVDIQTYMIYKNLKGRETKLEELIKHLKSTAKKYDDQIEQLSNACEERHQIFKSTDEYSSKILSKQKKVAEAVKKIYSDATAKGKLNYELSLLEDKLKEIDEFIEQFCSKVMETKIPHSSGSVKALFNVWNYLQQQWDIITSRLYNGKSEEDKE